MSARSRDAWRLAQLLTAHAKVSVELSWQGNTRSTYGGWHLRWCDGPTRSSMERLVRELIHRAPDIAGCIRAYERTGSDLAVAAALLLHLAQNPQDAPHVTALSADIAHDERENPQRADPDTLRRARALAATPIGRSDVTAQLRQHARAHGWEGVLAWLDSIAAARSDPAVADLTAARSRRAIESSPITSTGGD